MKITTFFVAIVTFAGFIARDDTADATIEELASDAINAARGFLQVWRREGL